MNDQRKLLVGVFVILLLTAGAIWFVERRAPDCSRVSYDGDGTEANPYEVSNVEQLQCIEEQGLDANYVQVSDIDASETASWKSGDGFDPIGRYNGTYEGDGYKITDLTIKVGDIGGMFGEVDTAGTIKNVSLVNAEVTDSTKSTDSFVGCLVGINQGTINESYASGSVSRAFMLGGLVGRNEGTIKKSYSSVSVDGAGYSGVGGLVGQNFGTVSESYATGPVDGSGQVGGLVGQNSGMIEKSYATGSVDGSRQVGGLVGRNEFREFEGTVTGSYWDMETTGQSTSAGNSTGLTTSEMVGSAAKSNMRGFDFADTWETVTREHVRGGYPVLAWQAERDSRD
jgi:hypothetical protein